MPEDVEVERRFPVDESVFALLAKCPRLSKSREYSKIDDTYYVFSPLKNKMVRARHAVLNYPEDTSRYELCLKTLFYPGVHSGEPGVFSVDEVAVKVDDFAGLQHILEQIKEEEFHIRGHRRVYKISPSSGLRFDTLTITTDFVEGLYHPHWVEIEIMLDKRRGEATQPIQHDAILTIESLAQRAFGVKPEFVQDYTVFPTYPEIYFWEHWQKVDWCKSHGQISTSFNADGLTPIG